MGSLADFDLGQKCLQALPQNRTVEVGSTSLTLQSDDWVITEAGATIADAPSFSDETADDLNRIFVGQKLLSLVFDKDAKECRVCFSNQLCITLVSGPDDDDLIALALPDGTLIGCDAVNGFVSDGSRSAARAAAYATARPR